MSWAKYNPWPTTSVDMILKIISVVRSVDETSEGLNLRTLTGQRPSFEHISSDEFRKNIQLVRVDVGDALDNPAGNDVDRWNDSCE